MFIDSMMWDVGLQDAAGYGRKCERIGYDCVWTYEAAHNPFMPLAQVAAASAGDAKALVAAQANRLELLSRSSRRR